MIVKIQRAQPPLGPKGQVLIYNRAMSRWWQGIPDPAVDKWMGGRQKVFAHARIVGTEFVIDSEAPRQDW